MSSMCSLAMAYLKASLPAGADPAAGLPPSEQPVLRPWLPGLVVAYVVDQPDGLHYVQNRHLAAEGVTADELHRAAVERLREFSLSRIRVDGRPGDLMMVRLDGNFEASMLLVDGFWDRGVRHTVQHGFVAAAPSRDVLVYCDSESPAHIASLRQIVAQVWAGGDHLLTRQLLRRRAGEAWELLA
jgi:uncharacterized protein YtpQ (UPF0354 family)